MPKNTTIIPKAPLARMLLDAGAKRVSEPAASEFSRVIEEKGIEIAKKAFELARHSGRKTIHAEDIFLAVQ
ncbi:histone family protein [Candidatus Woesearchaeota archaeon]|nr:histone family protein [Candidatus Woesearchaeota archaeon]